jgi:opine dehydrogenase
MLGKRLAILGGGNGARAMAADLSLKGLEVNICESPLFADTFRAILENPKLTLIDPAGKETTVNLHMATTNFEEALEGVNYIMMAMSAAGHEHFFNAILPFLKDGQTIVTWPGYYSSLRFANILRSKGIKTSITLAETHTFPYACRFLNSHKVKIFLEAWKILASAHPSQRTSTVVEDLQQLYPVVPSQNTLETSLNDPNPIVHSIVIILNAVNIETNAAFHFYRDGVTLPVARAIKSVHEEMVEIIKALGLEALEYPEESFWSKSGIMSVYFKAPFDKEGAAAGIDGPHSLTHRFITEDVPFGLVPAALLARKLGINVPSIDATIHLCSVLNNTNYLESGTSLTDLGLSTTDLKTVGNLI